VLQLNNIALILLLFITSILAVTPFAFAANPTPYNEWDFDITEVDVLQNESNLEKLDISITVLYKGELPQGTANYYANVTNPDGYSYMLFGQTRDMSIGEIHTVDLTAYMNVDGRYGIDV